MKKDEDALFFSWKSVRGGADRPRGKQSRLFRHRRPIEIISCNCEGD